MKIINFELVYKTLHKARVGSGSGENFRDPAKKVRIRPDPDLQP